jgi:hypothetical protein
VKLSLTLHPSQTSTKGTLEELRVIRLERYLRAGRKRVKGWLDDLSAHVIARIGLTQATRGLFGSVGEIGVHHGRLFILLYLCLQPKEKAFAIDVFAKQELNVDHSGRGDRWIFERNVRRWAGNLEALTIIEEASRTVTSEWLRATVGPARLISIDGGHSTATTLNDLRLADQLMIEGGVVILDDVFNPMWPGVLAGFARYMNLPERRMVPFAVSSAKLFLTTPSWAVKYQEVLKEASGPWRTKRKELDEHQVEVLYRERHSVRSILVTSKAYQRVRDTALGQRLRAIAMYGLRSPRLDE